MGFETVAHITPRTTLAFRLMQGELIGRERIMVLVNLHIELIFGIGVRIKKKWNVVIVNIRIEFGRASFH